MTNPPERFIPPLQLILVTFVADREARIVNV